MSLATGAATEVKVSWVARMEPEASVHDEIAT